ncbi:heavy metal translocating P-type ATPase [Ramlibacter monticola]|uniref:Heavy metal translocating P-type ATPase n=1 Tax=Ramlibacter monticola TaxID=1926872 RepID=A0A937CSP7_9BURK|nr:heavy metal translocating P-type ATPase [Ramlibacter monticola]MBL0391441.1 heavy metal translocating P-type ATPase [Ramlibacter monticola]
MPVTEKLRLDLPLLLPDVSEARDRCVGLLIAALKGKPGIRDAHVREAPGKPQLCIHYDPHEISLARVREIASANGARITDQIGHLAVRAAAMHARAARRLGAQVEQLPGVVEAEVAGTGGIRIEFDRSRTDAASLREQLRDLGIEEEASSDEHPHAEHGAEPAAHAHEEGEDHAHDHGPGDRHEGHAHAARAHAAHAHAHGGPFGEQSELIFALLAGVAVLAGWVIGRWSAAAPGVSLACYIAAYLLGGYFTSREALENTRARRFEIDTLMLVAAAGAAALGKWAEGALLLFLFSLGHSLEHYAMGRARRAIEALATLAPERALLRRGDGTVEVEVAELRIGDVVVVRPNERLPADGFVVRGQTCVDQAPVTGESVPVDKRPVGDPEAALRSFDHLPAQHRVFAGTINGPGAVDVMVARRSSESTMARVVKLVTEAEAQRSPTQNFTERFERIFVPVVLVLVVLLMFAWVVVDEPFSASFYRAMAVLVAASPCALAISVPSAVLSGVARAGRSGVLVKGGAPLENLGTLTAIAFDKTGTLTEGKPRLTDAVAAAGVAQGELLQVALALERHSDHPLAAAVVAGAGDLLVDAPQFAEAHDLRSITGRGVRGVVGGEAAYVGKPVLFEELPGPRPPADVLEANDRLVGSGRTTMIVRHGDRYLGVLGVMDTPRPVAAGVMKALQALGIERLIMISGDNQKVADAVARSVGLTEARGDLLPEDKVQAIQALRGQAGKVAMVGDGVNDAPAMAHATVGIAMGAAGSDVALETADVALMADDLGQLPFAVGLSRQTSRIIRQNLWVSLGVVAVLIPATILGLNIGVAVLFHEGSTLLVVGNALRLLAYGAGDAAAKPLGVARG